MGFAHLEMLEGCVHLEELDVHPAHGRRGVGSALVRAVCAWAQAAEFPAVTLTTYREFPWNAPFYRDLGFRALEPGEFTPGLSALVEKESRKGLEAEKRLVMRFETRPPDR